MTPLRIFTDTDLAVALRQMDQPRRGLLTAREKLAAGEAAKVVDEIAKLRATAGEGADADARLAALDTFLAAMKEPRRG